MFVSIFHLCIICIYLPGAISTYSYYICNYICSFSPSVCSMCSCVCRAVVVWSPLLVVVAVAVVVIVLTIIV